MTPDPKANPARPASNEATLPPSALSATPTPIGLLKALRRRWPLAIGIGAILGVVAAAMGWFLSPPGLYTARTTLRVPASNAFLVRSAVPAMRLEDHQRLQMAMVKSRLVLMSAIKDPRAANLSVLREQVEPVEWLERELAVDFNAAPEVLRISISGRQRDELIVLVNVIRDAYGREILDKELVDRIERLSKLQQLRQKSDEKLTTWREERRKFELISGGHDPEMRNMVMAYVQQHLGWNERELMQTQSELRKAKSDLVGLEANRKAGQVNSAPATLVEEQFAKEPEAQALQAKIRKLQSDIEGDERAALPGKSLPKVAQMRKELSELEKSMSDLRKKLSPNIAEDVKRRVQVDLDFAERQIRSRMVVLEQDEKALIGQIDSLRKQLRERSESAGQADIIKEDMTSIDELRKWLAREEDSLRLEIDAAPPRFTLLEDGLATRPPESKRRLMAAGGAGLGALGLVILIFALVEFRARRVGSPDEVTLGLGLPVVGAIPDRRLRSKKTRDGEEGLPFLNEAVDTFRTMLIKAGELETLRVVMITSAQSGEGKTSLSTHLASSLAQVGYATLLIDGDLRNPLAHQVFNLERGPGLCDYLRSESELEDIIRPTAINRLWMITAGKWDGGATRALAQEQTRQLVERLRSRFDYIIIDSSPVLPVVDPLLLGQCSDGAIISVLREVSRMPMVYAAYQRLTAGGIRVLGAVMNGVREEQYSSYYPYRDSAAVRA